jgi:hypothetical protein
MNMLWKLLALTLAGFCGSCTGGGESSEFNQHISLYEAARIGANSAEYAELAAGTGGSDRTAYETVTDALDDERAADMLEVVRNDETLAGRSVRALLVNNIVQRGQPSSRLRDAMILETGLSEDRFERRPDDVREYLVWATLALKFQDHGSIERVGMVAAGDPRMVATIRRDRLTLDSLCKNLTEHGRVDVAARIDWPHDVKGRADFAEAFHEGVDSFVGVVTFPRLILFGINPR